MHRPSLHRLLVWLAAAAIVIVACGSDGSSPRNGAAAPPATAGAAATEPAEAGDGNDDVTGEPQLPAASSGPAERPSVTFDGETCSLAGDLSVDPGLVDVVVLNTTPNLAEAIFGQLAVGSTIDDVTAEVAAGDYDDFGDRGPDWEPPPSLSARNPVVMPRDGDAPSRAGFAATAGSWIVICVDLVDQRASMASGTLEVR